MTLNGQHTGATPYIPESAPFTTEQRAWLNGYMAAMFSLLTSNPPPATSHQPPATSRQQPAAKTITLVFGSQSGTCEAIAKKTAKHFKQAGVNAKVIDAAQFDVTQLQHCESLALITSTYGEGEPPDNIASFYAALHHPTAPRLETLRYALLALGDRNYTHFCKTGRDFDARLHELGARRLCDLVECDVDYEAGYSLWLSQVTAALSDTAQTSEVSVAPSSSRESDRYSKANPFPAPILRNINLHSGDAARRTHHIEFDLTGAGLAYEAGDALGVIPQNSPALVDELLQLTGFDAHVGVPLPTGGETSLREALLSHYDITKVSMPQMAQLAERTRAEHWQELVKPGQTQALRDFLYGREWIDLLMVHPHMFGTPREFVVALRKLTPRLYSISSSPKAHPNQVHLTVSAVQYDSHGRKRYGVCSTDLANANRQTHKPIFIHPNKQFKLPNDGDIPIIMVGPGTGIAPFRAFLQERAATDARGKNWLFFGCWDAQNDFLYREELTQWHQSGMLNRLDVAFSRAQADKVYVQHLMQKQANELWTWLQVGAHFYVCGDAARMAKDVDAALIHIAQTTGGLNIEAAQTYVAELRAKKRYLRDVY